MYHINCGKESGRNTDAATAEYPDNVLLWRPGENGRYCAIDTDFFIFIGGSTMRNKKGFTLVELVIVIAVIAILAGVMIGTFASVVKKANESRKAQEMAAAKTEQTANDVIEKLSNSNWLGWEDFEEKLATRLTKAYQDAKSDVPVDAIQDAVKGAVAKYFAEHANENTGLTEEQVKYIVETAVAKNAYVGVTEAQVKAIVNAAVSGTSTLTKSQVQAIVDAAQARNLTLAQVSKAIADATKDFAKTDDISASADKILEAVNAVSSKALTEKQVKDIINAAVWNAGGVTKTWFDSTNYEATKQYTVSNAQEVAGLATLVNGGYNFEGKTITLNTTDKETTIKVDASNWTPIGNTRGSEFKGTISGGKNGVVIDGLTLDEQFNAVKNGYLINCSSTGYMDKVGVGFVAYLGEGATLENITFTNVKVDIRDPEMDGISVGVAVGYLDGGTVKNVKVTDGYVRSVYRVAGLIGAASSGTIADCTVGSADNGVEITSTGSTYVKAKVWNDKTKKFDDVTKDTVCNYTVAAGLIGYCRDFSNTTDEKITMSNVKVFATLENYGKTTINAKFTATVSGDIMVNGVKATNEGTGITAYTFTQVAPKTTTTSGS